MVQWRLRFRLILQDLSAMFLQCGIVFSHEAVRDWEAKLAPILGDELQQRRHWHEDETYLKVRGRWCDLYRAIDRNCDLLGTTLSEHGDMTPRRRATCDGFPSR